MAISRYTNSQMIDLKYFTSPGGYKGLKKAIDNGTIATFEYITKPKDRLDTLAHNFLGDGRYWWVIAIINDIGWGLQVTNGRTLIIPNSVTPVLDRI